MSEILKPKEILNIDITVTADNIENDLFEIYSKILKSVKKEELIFEKLRGGYVNSIFKASLKNSKEPTLIFRTFGINLDNKDDKNNSNDDEITKKNETSTSDFNAIFNRLSEFEVMNEVSSHGLSQPVYAKYNNGIVYGFSKGNPVSGPLMLTYDFLNEAATKLARFHSIKYEIPGLTFKTHYEKMNAILNPIIEKMVQTLNEEMTKINEFPFNGEFPLPSDLIKEGKNVIDLLNKIGMENVVFCHNDTNQMNLIWDPQARKLSFIDMEMTMPNYDIFELGSLFYAITGHFLYSFEKDFFPSENYRKRFLRLYLEERNRLNNIQLKSEKFEEELLKLFIQTNLTSLYNMLRVASMCPSFDFNPDLFKNEDLKEARKNIKFYCSKFGLKVYKLFEEKKEEFIKMAEDYIAKREKLNLKQN